MKCLVRSLHLLALLGLLSIASASCTSTTNTTVIDPLAITPTITRVSPDTVWTFRELRIYGTNFGYDPLAARVTIDSAIATVDSIDDTVISVRVPEAAATGPVRVKVYEQMATSATPVVVNYTFNPHAFGDSIPIGASFSIPGTGLNNYHGVLRLLVGGLAFPIDSDLPERIVSHVPASAFSGSISLSDSDKAFFPGTIVVTRFCGWSTLSEIWDNVTIREYHKRIGYTNGPNHPIDSAWYITNTISGQHDIDILGSMFARNGRGLAYSIASPALQMTWDTVGEVASLTLQLPDSRPVPTLTLTVDTQWNFMSAPNLSAPLPVDGAVEFVMPNFGYQIHMDSTDQKGLVSWQETTTATVISGNFDLIFK